MAKKSLKAYIPKLQSNLFSVPQLKEIWKRIAEGVENLTPPIVDSLVRGGYESSYMYNQSMQFTPQSYPTTANKAVWVNNYSGSAFTSAGKLLPAYSYFFYQDSNKESHVIYLDEECEVILAPRLAVFKTYKIYTKVYLTLSTDVLSQLQDVRDSGYNPSLKLTVPVLDWY